MLRGAGSCADPVIKHFTKEHVNYFSKPPLLYLKDLTCATVLLSI